MYLILDSPENDPDSGPSFSKAGLDLINRIKRYPVNKCKQTSTNRAIRWVVLPTFRTTRA